MQVLKTPLTDADFDLLPITRDRALVTPDFARTLSLVQGKQGNNLHCLQTDRNGGIVSGRPDHAGWTWIEGTTIPATSLTPFAGVDFDYLSLMCFEGLGSIRLLDQDDLVVDYAHTTVRGINAGSLPVTLDVFNVKARKFVINSLGTAIDLIYYLAGRRPS